MSRDRKNFVSTKLKPKRYPCLKRANRGGRFVMFTGPGVGVMLHTTKYADRWMLFLENTYNEAKYTPYDGAIEVGGLL